MRPFITRYPGYLAASTEFRDLQEGLEPELEALWTVREDALEQLCVETAGWGLRYWEETLGLPVNEEKSLGARRARVRTRLMGADVTTIPLLKCVAELHTGIPTEILEFPNQFQVELEFSLNSGPLENLEGLTEALKEIMPAHLGWGFRFLLKMETTLHAGGGPGMTVRLNIPAAADAPTFRSALHAGGTFGTGQTFPVPEDPSPPSATTILCTGGVCTIISNLSRGE